MKEPNSCEKDAGMKNWTSSAQQRLEEYFARIRGDLQASGADVEEVTEDLRRHVQQEAASLRLGVVTEADVGTILGRIGAPEGLGVLDRPSPKASPAMTGKTERPPKPPGSWVLFLGVLLPLGTIVFEFLTGACAATLFDPLPNYLHVVLTLLVPAGNFWVWWGLRGNAPLRPPLMGALLGVSMAVSLIYSMLFLPVSPFAVVGIIVYGLGLVPLSPYFALATTLFLQGRLASRMGGYASPNLWVGFLVGFAALALISAPVLFSRWGMDLAASENEVTRERGIRLLRSWGSEDELLRACYGRMGRSDELYSWGKELRQEQARHVYYRVYGRAFNSVPPPKLYAGRARWSVLEEEFTWDFDQGGDRVAARVKGLGLTSSRQDVVLDADAATAYIEWTMEFRNDSRLQREARAQILLPAGAVVSRLTLWINGEEREAAFGGRAQVRQAYKQVVEKRRDPVLVTTAGPDRILVQCFPVPPSGGLMKARIGVTAPLLLEKREAALLRFPCFLERNFSIPDSVRHSVWLDSNGEPASGLAALRPDPAGPRQFSLRGSVTEKELGSAKAVVRCKRDPLVTRSWAPDGSAEEAAVVRQDVVEQTLEPPASVVIVVDGTTGLREAYSALARALPSFPAGTAFACLQARDGVQDLTSGLHAADTRILDQCATRLRRSPTDGGHDNTAALVRAWDLAAEKKNGVIVWLHGPQPEVLNQTGDLRQRLERGAGKVRLISVQTEPGPNRILEELDGLADVRSQTLVGELASDLEHLFSGFRPGTTRLALSRQRLEPSVSGARDGREASRHLVRLWAADESVRKRNQRDIPEAMRVATTYQLVTPVSGAVVLETQAQYEQAGLQPVPATSVPMIPEPSAISLLLLGYGLFRFARGKGKR